MTVSEQHALDSLDKVYSEVSDQIHKDNVESWEDEEYDKYLKLVKDNNTTAYSRDNYIWWEHHEYLITGEVCYL